METDPQPHVDPPPPASPTPVSPPEKGHNWLKIVLITVACIVGLLTVVGAVIIFMIGSFFNSLGNDCENSRVAAYSAAQRAKPAFNRIVIIQGAPGKPVTMQKQAGDCFGSMPTAWLSRSVAVNETAEQAVAQVTASLQSQGYTGPTHDKDINPQASPCGYSELLTFRKKSQPDIGISMNCDDSQSVDGAWGSLLVTEVDAQLTFVGQE